jgi:hypothetical protein
MLNNVGCILRLAAAACCFGAWIFLPLCDLMLVFLLFCCMLQYELWVCDFSVFFVVLRYSPFLVIEACRPIAGQEPQEKQIKKSHY